MAERMTDERRQYIESYLTGCAKSSDEPWTIPDMLREALNEVDALRSEKAP